MEEEILNKIFKQNCGDSLLVLEKIKPEGSVRWLYRCQFQKYPCEVICQKGHILRGNINNPKINEYILVGKFFKQNCGDTLKVNKQVGGNLFEVEFLGEYYKTQTTKQNILKGSVYNPLYSELLNGQEYKQKNGYTFVIKEKKNGEYLGYFKEFPNVEVIKRKKEIIEGNIKDFEIQQYKIIGSIWKQNCGDELKIIKYLENGYYLCQFVHINCEVKARLDGIKRGNIQNPLINSKSEYMKDFLETFINKNFKNKKPSIQEVADALGKSRIWIGALIDKNNLRDLIQYYPNIQENILFKIINKFYFGEIVKNDNKILDGKEIDIYLPNLNLGIEFNGNYWHCDKLKELNYHQKKSLLAQEKGIRLVHIWEWEWNQRRDLLENYLKDIILGPFIKIGARKCIVKELSNKEYQNFCNKNHIQEEAGAKIKLGLFNKNELVQAMSFGSPRFTDKFEWEIIRECSKFGYGIIGGKEKLWSYFVKNYHPNNCISYCDFSKFTGESYLKLGFKKKRLNKPGFIWLSKDFQNVFWRNPYENNKLKHLNKLYDCGQLVFEWFKEG
jgi:hypothetical protein